MHEDEAGLARQTLRVLLRLGIAVAHQHDLGTERLDRVNLDLRRRPRHDDDGANAQAARGKGDALCVIPCARGDHAAAPLFRSQPRNPVVGAADLEAEDRLRVLALQQHVVVKTPRQAGRNVQRRLVDDLVDAARENLSKEAIHHGRR